MPSKKIWQVANIIGLIAVITVNALANALPINGKNTGALSDLYPNLFVPAGLTFSIWGLIYLLLIGFVVYGLGKSMTSANDFPHLDKIGGLFVLNCLANIGWIFSWHYLQIYLSLVIMLVLLGTLIAIYQKLEIGKFTASRSEILRVHIPFSVYLGWISVATIANATAVLVHSGWQGWGMGEVGWAITMIIVGMLLALRMLIGRLDLFYGAVVVWAYIGILIKRNQVATPGTEPISIVAGIAIGLILMVILIKINQYRKQYLSIGA